MKYQLITLLLLASICVSFSEERPRATQLGVAHIGGLYSFTETDYLNEGAKAVLDLGAKCIKVNLSLEPDNLPSKIYSFHSKWPDVETLDRLASTPYYRNLFAKEFDTFILNTFRPGRSGGYWRTQFTPEDEKAEVECFASLTKHFFRTYAGSNKTFILQNWEGDWALRGNFDPKSEPTAEATDAMIRWLAARQRGVEQAREEFPDGTVRVFHACEVNLVSQALELGSPSVTTDVLPHVSLDLVSYSAWDTKNSPEQFAKALDFIASHKLITKPFGAHGVYVGEFGLPESEGTPELVLSRTAELLKIAQQKGCPYAVYWQIYCNEPIKVPATTSADYKGFWLIRPDGTRSPVCDLFR
jgi:hypothetical protein